jgi:hypothetical protein
VFARSGAGKTEYIKRVWLAKIPRLVIVDQTGEWRELAEQNGGVADGVDAVLAAIRANASKQRWRIVALLDKGQLEELAKILLPQGKIDRCPSRLLGGMALFLDEVDQVAPTNGSDSIRSLFRRGRHAGLTIISASQRPGNVSKEVTSQSEFIAVLALHEANDVAYLEDVLGRQTARDALEWANSKPYRVALYFPRTGQLVKQEPAK